MQYPNSGKKKIKKSDGKDLCHLYEDFILFYFFMVVFIFLETQNKKKGLSNQEYSLGMEHQTIFVINRK